MISMVSRPLALCDETFLSQSTTVCERFLTAGRKHLFCQLRPSVDMAHLRHVPLATRRRVVLWG